MTTALTRIIDGDGHINEDLEAIANLLPPKFRDNPARALNASLFPALDHLHSGHFVETPGRRDRGLANGLVGPAEWEIFLREVGIDSTVLYPSRGLGFGKIVSRDWSIAVARAYNDWLHSAYLTRSPQFKGMALIPMLEPEAAIEELRRAVEDLGFVGAMLPSFGLPDHLGSKAYWGVYEEANRLGCAIAVHGGAHSGIGLDHMNVYAPIHALGHPLGQAYALASMTFNGVFERFPKMRVGFMEGGIAWFLMCWERFNASHATHMEYQLRDDDMLGPKIGENVTDYLQRQIDADRIFIGCEGDEPSLAYAVKELGNKPFLYSSDFPHEVTKDSCIGELNELKENEDLTSADKEAILYQNSLRFYQM